MGVLVSFVFALAVLPAVSWGAPSVAALDRGRLSLAWDAHDDGLCGEALGYLADIAPDSPVAPEGTWLEAECLYSLGRLAEAAEALGRPEARSLPGLEDFTLDVVWDWAWQASARGAFEQARRAVVEGRKLTGTNPYLDVLEALVRFRSDVVRCLGGAPPHDPVASTGATAPPGAGWLAVASLEQQGLWVPEATPDEWLAAPPGDGPLWLRVKKKAVSREIERFATELGLSAELGADGFTLARGGESVFVDVAETRFRAAVEGLGPVGAARLVVARALDSLEARIELLAWVGDHAGAAVLSREGALVVLTHPDTGRRFVFDPADWVDAFAPEDDGWLTEWGDILTEQGRPARPFRCFCGRDVVLREALTRRPGDAVVVEREGGRAVVLQALCPLHTQVVTSQVLSGWGVGVLDAVARLRSDGLDRPWDLAFERGRAGGTPYLLLEGDGVSGLPRRPDLLRGALEAVNGKGGLGDAVQVSAPAASVLVVMNAGARPRDIRDANVAALRKMVDRGVVERIGYSAVVRLPTRGAGQFRVRTGP